ncbi:EAL domain-containing protein, partial [Pseudomonas sp. FW306-2-11AD]|uniref:EAL domain-containing protein n=1 Tax=Pseudomonas sp. FW306-2-11AD TaxID=2070665 RepID=UPI000CC39207
AEAALSRAKEAGRNSFAFFKREMDVSVRERRALARDLKQAIAEDQLLVYYQPQARTCDGSLSGFEALVRWVHPVRGFLPPDQFVS